MFIASVTRVMFILVAALTVIEHGTSQVLPYNSSTYILINTSISEIPNDIPLKVQVIILRDNEITNMDSFGTFINLSTLDLTGNKLTEFPNVTSVGPSLLYLTLSNNGISEIQPDLLGGLFALRMLDLSHNRLSSFPDVFGPSNSFELLDISKNHFRVIPYLPYLGRNLHVLKASNNKISIVSPECLKVLTSLRLLDLSSNLLMEFPDVSPLAFSLQNLILAYNRIYQVPPSRLSKLRSLTFLDLRSCRLEEMPDFGKSPSKATLNSLQLTDNQIASIPLERLLSLRELKYLSVASNPIRTLPNLCYLWHSLLLRLPTGSMVCDCHLRWLRLAERAGIIMLEGSQLKPCAEPSSLSNTTWNAINLENLTCKDYSIKQAKSRRSDGLFNCPLCDVTWWIGARSLIQCADYCLRTDGCQSFQYRDVTTTNKGQANCGLSDGTSTQARLGTDLTELAWYTMD